MLSIRAYVKSERRIRRFLLRPARVPSAPASWRIGSGLMPCRSIRDPELIQRFLALPLPGAVSLACLIPPYSIEGGSLRHQSVAAAEVACRALAFASCP